MDTKDAKDITNWAALSKKLGLSKSTISRNRIPKIHQPRINEFLRVMQENFDRLFKIN